MSENINKEALEKELEELYDTLSDAEIAHAERCMGAYSMGFDPSDVLRKDTSCVRKRIDEIRSLLGLDKPLQTNEYTIVNNPKDEEIPF